MKPDISTLHNPDILTLQRHHSGGARQKDENLLYCLFVIEALAPPERVSLGLSAMNRIVEKVQESQLRKNIPEFRPGDTVRIHVRIREAEGEKERIQPFEGVVISKRGRATSATFTVRRVSFGIGVERIFPVHSPVISSIEVLRQGRVRRAKLYYLRGLKGKSARIKRVERIEQPVSESSES